MLKAFNYIDDNTNFKTRTSLIKSLILEKAKQIRLDKVEKGVEEPNEEEIILFCRASCHPLKKHYAKGLCRTCYLKKRYNKYENN